MDALAAPGAAERAAKDPAAPGPDPSSRARSAALPRAAALFDRLGEGCHGFVQDQVFGGQAGAIAANRARHYLRAAARRRKATDDFAFVGRATPDDPERMAERRSMARELQLALDVLSAEQRVTFVLCEVEGRSAREVAEIVGAPEATVRTRLHHARQKLRARLARRGAL